MRVITWKRVVLYVQAKASWKLRAELNQAVVGVVDQGRQWIGRILQELSDFDRDLVVQTGRAKSDAGRSDYIAVPLDQVWMIGHAAEQTVVVLDLNQ